MSRSVRKSRTVRLRFAGAGLGVIVVGTLLSGCGPDQAGSAAVFGSGKYTDQALTEQATALASALAVPLTPEQQSRVNSYLIDRQIKQELGNALAAKYNITISQGQIDTYLQQQYQAAGGKEQLYAAVLPEGITPAAINNVILTKMQFDAVAGAVAPGKTSAEQNAALFAAASAVADTMNIQVSPRFGSWNPESLGVVPPPDDISSPAPVTPLPQGLDPLPQTQP